MVAWLRAWTVAGLFLAWLVAELLAAFVPALRMRTLTRTVVDLLPYAVTAALVGWLVTWLPGHFAINYKRKGVDMSSLDPNQPQPSEPLLSVGTITALASALIGLGVAYGLPVDDAKKSAVLGVVAVLAPVAVALWGRRKVFSPATVARIMKAKAVAANAPKAGP